MIDYWLLEYYLSHIKCKDIQLLSNTNSKLNSRLWKLGEKSARLRLSMIEPTPSLWSGFHRKAFQEKRQQLALAYPGLFRDGCAAGLERLDGLDASIANNMIENCIGCVPLLN